MIANVPRVLLTLLVALLLASPALADDPAYLVKDLPGSTTYDSLTWQSFWVTLGDTAWFVADPGNFSRDLWKTNGTEAGTILVMSQTQPGGFRAGGRWIGTVNGRLIFTTGVERSGLVVAVDSATGVTSQLARTNLLALGAPGCLYRGMLYFVAQTSNGSVPLGMDLWHTDGTTAGTGFVDLYSDTNSLYDQAPVVMGDWMYFAGTTIVGRGIHRSDGTISGTTLIKELPAPISLPWLTVTEGRLYFYTSEGTWVSDGTSAGTSIFRAGVISSLLVSAGGDGKRLFYATDAAAGGELWITDLTPEGTQLLHDVNPGPQTSYPSSGEWAGSKFFFIATDGSSRNERSLFVTDGTPSGLKKLISSSLDEAWVPGFAFRGKYYFGMRGATDGMELYVSDGTVEGTHLFKDIQPGPLSGFRGGFLRLPNAVVFLGFNSGSGVEPWVTDGTREGTRLLKNIGADASVHGSRPDRIRADGDRVFFFATLPAGEAVGVSDGTSGGTSAEIVPYPVSAYSTSTLAAAGKRYFFSNATTIFASDATIAGTVPIYSELTGSGAIHPIPFRNGILFPGRHPSGGWVPWYSDGTLAGTRMVAETLPPSPYSDSVRFYSSGSSAWLATDGVVWKSDGTAQGTSKFVAAGLALPIAESGGVTYFVGGDLSGRLELWRIGENDALVKLKTLTSGGNDYYKASGSAGDSFFLTTFNTVWRSDGTESGTILVSESSSPCLLVPAGDLMYWFHYTTNIGYELWRSDGTIAGTRKVTTLPYASQCSAASLNGLLYFAGDDGVHGRELWVSDGTAAGTHLAQDIFPGLASSSPDELTVAGKRIFFSADSPEHGRELWAVGPRGTIRRRSAAH